MQTLPILKILLTLPILLTSAVFLVPGASILLRRRPVLVRGGILMGLVSLVTGLVALSLILFVVSASSGSVTCLGVIQILILGVFTATVQRRARGYFLLGITTESFRQAVQTAFSELGLPFEESILGFRLPSLQSSIKASISPRLGTAQLLIEDPGQARVLDEVARHVNSYLQRTYGTQSVGSGLIYTAAGLIFLVLAAYQWGRFQP